MMLLKALNMMNWVKKLSILGLLNTNDFVEKANYGTKIGKI